MPIDLKKILATIQNIKDNLKKLPPQRGNFLCLILFDEDTKDLDNIIIFQKEIMARGFSF